MTSKQQYIQLCARHEYGKQIPIFTQPIWLDAVAENWDVVLFIENKKNIAALPFCWKGNFITKRIYLPDFSFYQSILFFENDLSDEEKNSIAINLFLQLPKTVKQYFKFSPEYSAIDLSKLNYKKEDYCTYIIDKNQLNFSLSTNHKRNIQKGIKQQYTIEESKNSAVSFSVLTSTFARQLVQSKINFATFNKLQLLAKKNKFGKIIDCIDSQNNLLASVFIVIDEQTIYYLFGGYNAEFKNSGAMTFLLHHVIQTALDQQKDFNFCGSSKKTIAHFFEGFGATKTDIAIWQKSIL